MLSRYSQKKRWIEIEGFGSDLNQTSQDRDSWVPHYQFYNTFVEKNLIILELFTETTLGAKSNKRCDRLKYQIKFIVQINPIVFTAKSTGN